MVVFNELQTQKESQSFQSISLLAYHVSTHISGNTVCLFFGKCKRPKYFLEVVNNHYIIVIESASNLYLSVELIKIGAEPRTCDEYIFTYMNEFHGLLEGGRDGDEITP